MKMTSKRIIEYNFDYAIQFNRWSMQCFGLWPIEDRLSNFRFNFTLITIILLTIPVTIKCFYLDNFFKEIETILLSINLISTIIKMSFLRASKSKLALIVQDMIFDWNDTPLSEESRIAMNYNLKRARTLTAICIIFIHSALISK